MSIHILIIRLSAFGDVAMTVPAISVLRDNHPGMKITILTTEFFSSLYNQIPNIYGTIGLVLIIAGVVMLNIFGKVK